MLLSIVGFILVNIAQIHYFSKLKKNQTPKNPIFLTLSLFVGSSLSLLAIASLFTEPSPLIHKVVVIVLGLIVLSTSATFALFLLTKSTPIGEIKVSVGDSILPFSTANFDSSSLIGKRTLLKFYRGSWCPYCSAELIMFEALKPKFEEFNVQVIGISNDTSEQQKSHLKRDNISLTLVSDPDLTIIRQYGVEHHKALGATASDTISMFGIAMPLPWKMKYKAMSIPTTILVDELGKIVWIDQSEDYRLRASEEAVMGAITSSFDLKN